MTKRLHHCTRHARERTALHWRCANSPLLYPKQIRARGFCDVSIAVEKNRVVSALLVGLHARDDVGNFAAGFKTRQGVVRQNAHATRNNFGRGRISFARVQAHYQRRRVRALG